MVEIVRTKGPHRVMIDNDEATSGKRARERNIGYDVVFIRNDGWTLGASHALEAAAENMWLTDWQAKMDVATGTLTFY